MTVPVKEGGSQSLSISEIQVESTDWIESHVSKIEQAYKKFPYSSDLNFILDALSSLKTTQNLSQVNELTFSAILDALEIEIEIVRASEFEHSGTASEKLAGLAKEVKATRYLTAPTAANYLEHSPFNSHCIAVEYADYSKLQVDQKGKIPGGEYSIIDLIARVGLNQTRSLTRFLY